MLGLCGLPDLIIRLIALAMALLGLVWPDAARIGEGLVHPANASASAAPITDIGRIAGLCGDDSPLPLRETANELLADRYHLGQHPVAALPHRLSWTEDPFGDRQWRQKLQMLRYVNALAFAWQETGDERYRSRARSLVRSWLRSNPYDAPASGAAWRSQVTAWRTMTLICLADVIPGDWLTQAIAEHGGILYRPDVWVRKGNHALNQALALLDAGCHLGRTAWQRRAAKRIGILARQEIDTQGVSAEQATKYDLYDYDRFSVAIALLAACGVPAPADLDRVARIPDFLAQATRPDGHLETIGDTDDVSLRPIPGTATEFTASGCSIGQPPGRTVAIYDAGYAFIRTGWGEERPFSEETFVSLRFQRSHRSHGHDDSGGVTLHGAGGQLLVDPGYGDQNDSRWHRFFISRAAHNVVRVDGVTAHPERGSVLTRRVVTRDAVDLSIRIRVYPGVSLQRRVIVSRRLGYVVVEDTMRSTMPLRYEQLWHLRPGSRPTISGPRAWTRSGHGDVLIRQLLATGAMGQVVGSTSPIQGWVSSSYGQRVPAPVIVQAVHGRSARLVTLLVPFAAPNERGRPPIAVRDVRVTPDGFRFVLSVGGRRERLVATASGVSVSG
jgi:hypothetical protein